MLPVESQECGCPCPNAMIIKGELDIPMNFFDYHPVIHNKGINLTGGSPYKLTKKTI